MAANIRICMGIPAIDTTIPNEKRLTLFHSVFLASGVVNFPIYPDLKRFTEIKEIVFLRY